MLAELENINRFTEQALYYARSEHPEKDYCVREINLNDVVHSAIADSKYLLRQNHVTVTVDKMENRVYTDEKWAVFILGQLFQNAARYRGPKPVITLSAKSLGRQTQLIVHDNGIGIPAHELPRVFERGFTGSNGRACGGSTGMGLYLCRKLASFLDLELRIVSQEGAGTTVTLTFPAKENLTKL